jgi:hypothetical protein
MNKPRKMFWIPGERERFMKPGKAKITRRDRTNMSSLYDAFLNLNESGYLVHGDVGKILRSTQQLEGAY